METQVNSQFIEVQVCPHCNALAKESRTLEVTFCSDGCGCIEGEKSVYKFECQNCWSICNEEKCSNCNPKHKVERYRNYSIQKDWRNPYSNVPEFMYYLTKEGVDHDGDFDGEDWHYCGNCKWASDLEEAKLEIDEIWSKKGIYKFQYKFKVIGANAHAFMIDDTIQEALDRLELTFRRTDWELVSITKLW